MTQTLKQIAVGIIAAIGAVMFLAAWDKVFEGHLIRMLGGLTVASLEDEEILERIRGPEGPPGSQGPSADVPVGAVVAFDHPSGCPDGWKKFDAGADRVIIGVGEKYKLPYVEGKPNYQIGGAPSQTIAIKHLPKHRHDVKDPGHTHIARAPAHSEGKASSQGWPDGNVHKRFRTSDRPTNDDPEEAVVQKDALEKSETKIDIKETGLGQPIDIMPPYIPLYFCKKAN